MNYKKALLAVTVSCLMTLSGIPVYATNSDISNDDTNMSDNSKDIEQSDTNKNFNLFSANLDDVYSAMSKSIKGGENISLSDAFNQVSDFSISTGSYMDTSDLQLGSSVDFGTVNLQYCNLAQNMTDKFNTSDLSGNSINCLSLFENTYGDVLNSVKLENPTIPEGFTVDNMLAQGQSAIDSAYQSATSSSSFTSIKNSISIGNIFSKANQGLSMPELASNDTLSGLISSSSQSQKSQITGEYDDRRNWINEKRSSVKQDTLSDLNKSFLSAYDTYSKSDISANTGSKNEDTSDSSSSESSTAKAANNYVTQALDDNNGKFNKDTVVTAYYYYVISSDNVAESERNKVRSAGKKAFIDNDANRLYAQTWYDSTQME